MATETNASIGAQLDEVHDRINSLSETLDVRSAGGEGKLLSSVAGFANALDKHRSQGRLAPDVALSLFKKRRGLRDDGSMDCQSRTHVCVCVCVCR